MLLFIIQSKILQTVDNFVCIYYSKLLYICFFVSLIYSFIAIYIKYKHLMKFKEACFLLHENLFILLLYLCRYCIEMKMLYLYSRFRFENFFSIFFKWVC